MVEERRAIIDRVKSGKQKGQFKFVLKALNGEVIARSHPESYTRLQSAVDTLENNFRDYVIYEKLPGGQLRKLGNFTKQEDRPY